MSNYLDTRDLLTELEELEARFVSEDTDDPVEPLDEWEADRMEALRTLIDEIGEQTARDGETMIPEDSWVDYAEQTADELGLIPDTNAWPASYIDWQAAADALAIDYSQVEFDGTTYFYRAS